MPDDYRPLIPAVRPSFNRIDIERTECRIIYALVDASGTQHGERTVTVPHDPADQMHVALAQAVEAISEKMKDTIK
jgi:hypothetical protein